jgi:RHS repeat-associated protein
MPVSGVAISPARSVLDSEQQEPLSAVVEDPNGEPHPNQAVTWSVAGPTPASIATNGLFTAPGVPGIYTVTATSAADPTKSGTATITVGEDLMILPSSASLAPGARQSFTAQVSGVTNPTVTWSIEEGAAGGSISTAGLYTAPAASGTYHVLAAATAAGGGTVQGLATVTVSAGPRVGIAVAPAETTIAAGGMQQFTAAVTGAADTGVVWSASAGSIDATGLFAAPATDGTVTITATSHADSQVQASATAVVTVPGQGQAFQYDANGNVLSDGTRTYEWDAENRLTAINIGTQRSQFAYDGLGRRVLITELSNGAVVTSRHYIWLGDEIVEETDATVDPTGTVTGPGNYDSLNCNQVAGWAWNPAQPNTPVSVSIESGSTTVSTVLANNYRSDLKLAGAGNGSHGFTYPLPALFKTNTAQSVTLSITGTTTSLGTRTVTCPTPSFSGSFDLATCTQLAGWGWDANEPNNPIDIDIYDGTAKIATVLSSTFRQDLLNAGIGNGNHGFVLPTPAALKTGTAHTITLKAGGTPTVLGTPQTLTCSSANFGGYFDTADCTQLVGWAWDANQPNAALNVDIYDNGALLATIPAANFRQDLQNAGKGNGDHGFAYSSPALYSGTPHSLSINYAGTTIPLAGSPKAITCPTEPILTRFFPGGMQSGGANYYFSYDHLGSVREVTDTSGNVVSRYDYDPYGLLTVNQGGPPRFGFAGMYYHQPSGLSLTKYRAYDPSLGRWESRDPGEGGLNLYQYADSNPVGLYDPDGAKPIPPSNPPSPLPPGWGPTLPDGSPEVGPDGLPPGLGGGWPWDPDLPIWWAPDSRNGRGGNWYQPGNPKAPKASWEDGPNTKIPHWDKDDGNGNRRRCTPDKAPVTPDEAHRPPAKPTPPGKPTAMQQLLEDAKRLLNPVPFLQWLADHPPAPSNANATTLPPFWWILVGG